MKPSHIPVDNSLLISRFQQKELYQATPGTSTVSVTMTELTSHRIQPFFDPLAIKIGLELKLLGSKIINAKVERGYLFHDLETILAEDSCSEAVHDIARINQRTPIFYQLALIAAYEDILGSEAEKNIKQMRAFAIEITRVYHHLCILKEVFTSLNTNTLYDLSRNAKNIIKPYYQAFGKIFKKEENNPSINELELADNFDTILQLIDEIESSIEYETILSQHLRKKATINLALASSLGLSGAFIRANRCYYDLRNTPHQSIDYGIAPQANIAEGGDAMARLYIRIRDLYASIVWLKERLSYFKKEKISLFSLREDPALTLTPATKNFGSGEVEGPEGHIKVSIVITEQRKPIIHLRTPAYFIAQSIPRLLLYADLHDLPLLLASLGIIAEEIDK